MSQLQVGDELFQILDNVPAEYTALSDAISRLFYVCGSGKLCGACFQGKLVDYSGTERLRYYTADETKERDRYKQGLTATSYPSHGCCEGCRNLSAIGCVQKPIGCAAWQCSYSSLLLPERISLFLNGNFGGETQPSARRGRKYRTVEGTLSAWLYKHTRKSLFEFFRISGFNLQLDSKGLLALKTAAKRINRISDWLERTGLNKPNWPLMEKITRADKGVLYEPSV